MVPFLIGPVDIGSSFMMVTTLNNIPYVLVSLYIEQLGATVYGLENNLTTVFDSGTINENLAIFTASGTLDAVQLTDVVIGGGMATNTEGQLINVPNDPQTLVMSQSQFANWNPPNLFLTMTDYSISQTNGSPVTIGSHTSLKFNILPLTWYYTCRGNACCNLNTAGTILSNWFCIYDSTQAWCHNDDTFPITTTGWTSLADCTTGNVYTYCPPQQYCGNNNCKGPCQNISSNCNWQSNQYGCQVDLNKAAANLKWWESPLFIGGMVGLGVLIIFFVILIFVVARHGREKNELTSSD